MALREDMSAQEADPLPADEHAAPPGMILAFPNYRIGPKVDTAVTPVTGEGAVLLSFADAKRRTGMPVADRMAEVFRKRQSREQRPERASDERENVQREDILAAVDALTIPVEDRTSADRMIATVLDVFAILTRTHPGMVEQDSVLLKYQIVGMLLQRGKTDPVCADQLMERISNSHESGRV